MTTTTPPREKPGRKPKLAPELADELERLLQQGHVISITCAAAGVGERTFHRWMKQRETESSGPFWQFRQRMEKARARCEVALLDTVQRESKTNWKAAVWMLERMFPARYGNREKLEIKHAGQIGEEMIVRKPIEFFIPKVMSTCRITAPPRAAVNGHAHPAP